MKAQLATILGLVLALYQAVCHGQANTDRRAEAPLPIKKKEEIKFKHRSFTFVRIKYSSVPRNPTLGRAAPMKWAIDFPNSDLNFSARFQKEMGLRTDLNGKVMTLTDPALKQYPFIYIVEPGDMQLTEDEVKALRAYLLEGGFLMVDDFWGEREWEVCAAQIKRVFPERQPVELPIDHPVFHCYYDIQKKPQIPNVALGIRSQFTGVTWEREDAKEPHFRGLFDDKGRLMAIFCHNTDLGDGWEGATIDEYFRREFSDKKAFPLGINIVVYALTH